MANGYNFPIGINSGLPNIGNSLQYGVTPPVSAQVPQNTVGAYKPIEFGLNQQSMLGGANNIGWLTGGASVAGSMFNAWNGIQQLNQAKKQFSFQKDYANRNLANQATTINNTIEDRQRSRLTSLERSGAKNPYGSLANYMSKHSVNGNSIG
jgi:hypothetical protein